MNGWAEENLGVMSDGTDYGVNIVRAEEEEGVDIVTGERVNIVEGKN